ncbi:Ger(x)C family spore germination protein [Paenibacillus sp. SI8]|uniref:Ger(x)C family spore germination protein n=1 Tax=unclassified Paenibacillus TaxID=185978 RepID=UPI00346625D6
MANHMRISALGIMFALCTVLLTACWDRTETNDIAFVLSSSVDLEDDGRYRVAYIFPLPGSMGGASGGGGGTSGGKSYYIDSEVGATMREASSKLQLRMSRRLFLSHRRTIVIGEKLAKAGISPLLDVVPRTPESRLTCFLVLTKGKGYDLLNTEPKFERFPAEAIRELTKSRQAMGTSTKDVGLALSFGSDPIISYIEARESQSDKKPSHEIQLIGYGQFKGDQLVGIYKKQEATGLMWLRNNVKEHTFTFPMKPDESGQDISILVTQGQTEITPDLQGDKLIFNIKLNASGFVREDLSKQDLSKPDNLHQVEIKLAEQVKKSVQATLARMQEEGTDSAQLSLKVWRKYPNAWNNTLKAQWLDLFKEAEFRITAEASISETGLINQNVIINGR